MKGFIGEKKKSRESFTYNWSGIGGLELRAIELRQDRISRANTSIWIVAE